MQSFKGTIPLLLAVIALQVPAACGPSVQIDPLIGDDPELIQYVATSVPDLSEHAPTLAVRALYDALVREDMAAAWDMLTPATHEALDKAARETGVTDGKTLFVEAASRGVPITRAGGHSDRVTVLQWLLREDIAYYRLTLDPERSPVETSTEARVYIIDSDEQFREIQLARVGGRWLIHQPALQQ